jgi:N-acetylmuramoyl-L-alanine amidase
MLAGQNFFHKLFARVSPVFIAFAMAFFCANSSLASEDSDKPNNATRREAASSQFARAEDLRAELNSKPIEKRALSEYKQVVSSYRRVYLITPHANEVPDGLLAVAELYSEMGDKFGRSYYQVSVDTYKFLVHEYPTTHYGQDAMLRMARLQKDQLGDAAGASKTFEEFLKKYPRSARKREVQESLAEIALLRSGEEASGPKKEVTSSDAGKAAEKTAAAAESARKVPADAASVYAAANSGKVPRLRRIGTSASEDSTRVTIDLEDLVQYDSARIRNPDRIFFDLHAARLTPELARQNIHVEGDLLSAVRVAQNQAGVVRVVLNISGVKDYTASLLTNPPQLVIDLYPNTRATAVRAAKAKRNATQVPIEDPSVKSAEVRDERAGVQAVSTAATRVEPFGPPASADTGAATGSISAVPVGPVNASNTGSSVLPAPRNTSLMAPAGGKSRKNAKSVGAKPATTEKASATDKPDLIQPASAALPTRDGQSTLTRPNRDRCRPWRTRYGNDRAYGFDGKRHLPRCGATARQNHSSAAARGRSRVYPLGRHLHSAGRAHTRRQRIQSRPVHFNSCKLQP